MKHRSLTSQQHKKHRPFFPWKNLSCFPKPWELHPRLMMDFDISVIKESVVRICQGGTLDAWKMNSCGTVQLIYSKWGNEDFRSLNISGRHPAPRLSGASNGTSKLCKFCQSEKCWILDKNTSTSGNCWSWSFFCSFLKKSSLPNQSQPVYLSTCAIPNLSSRELFSSGEDGPG